MMLRRLLRQPVGHRALCSAVSGERLTGTVKEWKGRSGMITAPDGTDLRVIQDGIVAKNRMRFRSLWEGSEVDFEISEAGDTPLAVNVTPVGGGFIPRYRHYDGCGRFVVRPSWKKSITGEVKETKNLTKVGNVVSAKNSKTAVVEVVLGTYAHPKYGKYVTKKTTYPCHDPKSECRFGDVVEIESCGRRGKTKTHRVTRIIKEENYIDRANPKQLKV